MIDLPAKLSSLPSDNKGKCSSNKWHSIMCPVLSPLKVIVTGKGVRFNRDEKTTGSCPFSVSSLEIIFLMSFMPSITVSLLLVWKQRHPFVNSASFQDILAFLHFYTSFLNFWRQILFFVNRYTEQHETTKLSNRVEQEAVSIQETRRIILRSKFLKELHQNFNFFPVFINWNIHNYTKLWSFRSKRNWIPWCHSKDKSLAKKDEMRNIWWQKQPSHVAFLNITSSTWMDE